MDHPKLEIVPSLKQKWEAVKAYYENSHFDPIDPKKKWKFNGMPSKENIVKLHDSMLKFQKTMLNFYWEKPGLRQRRLKAMGLIEEPKNES